MHATIISLFVKTDINTLENRHRYFETEINTFKTDINTLKTDINSP